MSSGLIGKKVGMTNIFDDEGRNYAVTVIEVDPCVVTQIKTDKTDGYEAVQLAALEKSSKNTSKPLKGHFEKEDTIPKQYVKEFNSFIHKHDAVGDKL